MLHVWPRSSGTSEWYDDDGSTQAHTTGACQVRTLRLEARPRGGSLEIGEARGAYTGSTRTWRIVLRGLHREPSVRVDGRPAKVRFVPELGIAAFDMPAVAPASTAVWR